MSTLHKEGVDNTFIRVSSPTGYGSDGEKKSRKRRLEVDEQGEEIEQSSPKRHRVGKLASHPLFTFQSPSPIPPSSSTPFWDHRLDV